MPNAKQRKRLVEYRLKKRLIFIAFDTSWKIKSCGMTVRSMHVASEACDIGIYVSICIIHVYGDSAVFFCHDA